MMPTRRRILIALLPLLLAVAAVPSAAGPVAALKASSDQPIDLVYPEPASVREIYRSLGNAFGIDVLFDPRFKDRKVSVVLRRATLEKALATLARTAGHYHRVLDERSLLVAEDTPQNRRTYELQVAQTLPLENVRVADAMTALRSLIGVKHISANESLDALIVRDAAGVAAVAADLVGRFDKPRGEVTVEIELLRVEAGTLRSLRQGGGPAPLRLDGPGLGRLRKAAGLDVVAHTSLGVLDGDRGRLALVDRVPIRLGPGSTVYQEVGLELELTPEVHPVSGEVTLCLELGLSSQSPGGRDPSEGPRFGAREMESSVRVADGQSLLWAGLFRTGAGPRPYLVSPLDGPEAGRAELALVLTPRIVRRSGFTDADLAPYRLGTDAYVTRPDSGGG